MYAETCRSDSEWVHFALDMPCRPSVIINLLHCLKINCVITTKYRQVHLVLARLVGRLQTDTQHIGVIQKPNWLTLSIVDVNNQPSLCHYTQASDSFVKYGTIYVFGLTD